MGRRQYLCGSPNPTTFAPYPPSLLQQTAHHLVEQIRPSIGCSNKAIRLARKHCHAIYFCQRKNRYPRTAKSPCKDCLRTRTNFFRPHRHECETLRGIITGSRRYPPRTKRTPNSSFRVISSARIYVNAFSIWPKLWVVKLPQMRYWGISL